ncbi:hypothetical protein H9L21_08385 [Aeromicrobium senzhongii]|nr:hypothetical protein [Aeromicrobium senzhongii]QNL93161.1 hypothetical protein H9L21_08385 [Aeromicrobium senzhongii]
MVLAIAVMVAVFVWWLVILLEALRVPRERWEVAGQSQLIYVLLMVFLGIVGSIAYVAVARPRLRAASVPAAGV